MANINKIVGNAMSALGEAYEKHPYLTSEVMGVFDGIQYGAIIGGIAGGINKDETFLGGAKKGAMVGAGIGLVGGIPYSALAAKVYKTDIKGMGKAFKTTSRFLYNSFDDSDIKAMNKAFKTTASHISGLGYDGIGL